MYDGAVNSQVMGANGIFYWRTGTAGLEGGQYKAPTKHHGKNLDLYYWRQCEGSGA
jgi:hypothetical protein